MDRKPAPAATFTEVEEAPTPSIAAIMGPGGQSNHAAANVFLDQLIAYRQSKGLTGLSINWGAWSETGSATH